MTRPLSALVVLTFGTLAACARGAGTAALDHDDTIAHQSAKSGTGERIATLIANADTSIAAGDSVTARVLLGDAEATADETPDLVFQVAAAEERLGDRPSAAMAFRHYLVLAPQGPHATVALAHADALVLGPDPTAQRVPARAPARAVAEVREPSLSTPAPHAARRASHAIARSHVVATTRVPDRATRRVAVAAPARSATARSASAPMPAATTQPASDHRQTAVADRVVLRESGAVDSTTVAPAARTKRRTSSTGRSAVVGAATGAVLGGVFGHGMKSTIAGMVLGGALGAAVGGHAGAF